jgi:hypothetical protein
MVTGSIVRNNASPMTAAMRDVALVLEVDRERAGVA